MFGDQQSPKPEISLRPPLIFVACAAGGCLLSLGLCGVAAAIPDSRSSALGAGFDIAGLVVLGLSVLGIIVGCLWLVGATIIHAIRR